jgi:uncharacterized protein (TIGR02453 family)
MAEGYFSRDLFKFLSDLAKNNNREWFNANKGRYEELVKEPFLDFISDAGPRLKKISSHVVADPRPVGGSLFRIHRDVRFAKDKSPYKTNIGAHFRHSAGKEVAAPSFYLHVAPGESFIAGGMYQPDSAALAKIRTRIVERPAEWKKVLTAEIKLSDNYRLSRPPRGFDANHQFIEDVKLKSFISSVMLTEKEVTDPRFMSRFIDTCRSVNPLMKFLAAAVGQPW